MVGTFLGFGSLETSWEYWIPLYRKVTARTYLERKVVKLPGSVGFLYTAKLRR